MTSLVLVNRRVLSSCVLVRPQRSCFASVFLRAVCVDNAVHKSWIQHRLASNGGWVFFVPMLAFSWVFSLARSVFVVPGCFLLPVFGGFRVPRSALYPGAQNTVGTPNTGNNKHPGTKHTPIREQKIWCPRGTGPLFSVQHPQPMSESLTQELCPKVIRRFLQFILNTFLHNHLSIFSHSLRPTRLELCSIVQ